MAILELMRSFLGKAKEILSKTFTNLDFSSLKDINQTTPLTQDYYVADPKMWWMIEEVNGVLIFSSSWDRNYVLDINCTKLASDKELILSKRQEEAPYQQWALKAI